MNRQTLNYLVDLRYGNLTKDHIATIEAGDTVFDKYAEYFKDEPYPLPESTKIEIDNLIKLQEESLKKENWKDIKELIDLIDIEPLQVIEQLINDLKIEFKYEYFEKVSDRIGSFILKLKAFYNRPRPYQVALYTDQKFNPFTTVSGHTPAYPSGHTIQAYFICKIIAFHNPEKEKEIMEIAKMVSDSREILGVHYESDNLYSRYIVDQLCDIKEIKDIYFNPKKKKEAK